MADDDRAQVYAAELMAFDGTDLEQVVPFDDLLVLAERVMGDPWWPVDPVPVRAARSDAQSSSTRSGRDVVVRLARPQQTPATLVHELAHVVAGLDAGHGPLFRRAHVDVAALAFGPEPARWLATAYHAAALALAERPWSGPPSGAIAL